MATLTAIWTFVKGLPRWGKEILTGLVAILVILWEAKGKQQAERDTQVAKGETTDAVLAQKQTDIQQQEQQVQQHGDAQKQAVQGENPDQIAKDLNNV